jgi:hypothetical protein
MADPESTEPPKEEPKSSMAALLDRMFVLLPLQATTNYSVRGLLPQLIQDIVMVQVPTTTPVL